MRKAKSVNAKLQQQPKAVKPAPGATAQLRSSGGWDGQPIPQQWPDPPAEEAYYGLAGDVVRTIEPHTEASPVALLIQTLQCFGNIVGRTAYFTAEASKHFMNLYGVLVGVTSVGRKGSSWAQVSRIFRIVDREWGQTESEQTRILSGLSSGEGLIWAVRDPITKQEAIREKGSYRTTGEYQDVQTDRGVSDKRLFVYESEFASPLQMMAREGNTLSVVLRQAWDSGDLNTLTKNSPAKATGAHVSVVGHVTRDELRRELSTTDMANGFANRILWVCATRSKELPEGGNLTDSDLGPLVERLKDAVAFAQNVGEMKRDPAIKELWARTYHELTTGRRGLLGPSRLGQKHRPCGWLVCTRFWTSPPWCVRSIYWRLFLCGSIV
jgi:hypothetical protein